MLDDPDPETDALQGRLRDLKPAQDDAEGRLLRNATVKRLSGVDAAPVMVGRFTILGVIGRGGIGTVYEANDPRLDRRIALKIVPARGDDGQQLIEARALARLSHPNTVVVFDAERIGDELCIAMELVRGRNLREHVRAKQPDAAACVELVIAAGRGLVAAHAARLVHRDVKPENILVGDDGRVRIGDFGLATVQRPSGPRLETRDGAHPELRPEALATLSTMRFAGQAGTPAYMSPEQRRGEPIDARSDQYSLCLTALEIVQRRRPCFGMDGARLEDAEPWGEAVQLPAAIRHVLERGLAADPAQRFPTLDALLAALADSVPRRRNHRAILVAGAALVAGAVAGGWWLQQRDRGDACDGAVAGLARVWNAERAAAILERFAQLGPSDGAVGARLVGQIETYAHDWLDVERTSCRATPDASQSADLFDRRAGCLESRRRELGTVVAFLANEAGTLDVARSIDAVGNLTGLDGCDAEHASRIDASLPSDPDKRVRAQAIKAELGEVIALRDLGKFPEAIAKVRIQVALAEAVGHAPLIATAEGWLAEATIGSEDYPATLPIVDHAIRSAALAHDDMLEARTWLLRMFALFRLGRYDEALATRLSIEAALDRASGVDITFLRGRLLMYVGNILAEQGKPDPAIVAIRQALPLLEHTPVPYRARDVASGHGALAQALVARGDFAAARTEYETALRMLESAVGDRHPDVAMVLASLASVKAVTGARDEQIADLVRALAILDAMLPPSSQAIGYSRNALGVAFHDRQQLDQAWIELERARAIFEVVGPGRMLGMVLRNEGDLRVDQGRNTDAITLLRRALTVQEAALGPMHGELTLTLGALSDALEALDPRSLEAERLLQRSLAIETAAYGEHHRFAANTRGDLGYLMIQRAEVAAGEAHCQTARTDIEAAAGPDATELEVAWLCLGEAALATHRIPSGLAAAERALALRPTAAEPSWLVARVLTAAGKDRARAHKLAQSALDTYTKAGTSEPLRLAVEQWLRAH